MKKRILLPTSFFFIALFSIFLLGFMIGSFFLAQIIDKIKPNPEKDRYIITRPKNRTEENNTYCRIGNYFHRECCEKVDKEEFYNINYSYNRKENIEDGLIPCPHCNP